MLLNQSYKYYLALMASNQLLRQITLPKDFAKVPLVLIGMNLQLFFTGYAVVKLRRQLFNKQFMQKYFGEVHMNELKVEIAPNGYPDLGNGIYTQKLSYSDWYRLGVLQRIHQHYVENISLASIAVVAAGIVKPNYGLGVGLTYMLGRALWSIFYRMETGGVRSKKRVFAIGLCHIATLTGIGLFLWKYFKHGFA